MSALFIYGATSPTRTAHEVDALFAFILAICAFFFILTQGMLLYFAFRYRKKGAGENITPDIRDNLVLESIWIVIPTIVVMIIFVYGWIVYDRMTKPTHGAYEINVIGKKWLWEFEYSDGRRAINTMHVPMGKPVRLVMTSEDVIHSFYIPDFRIKQDVVPGRYTYLWFTAQITGEYIVYCAEFCGAGHSLMTGKVVVLEPEDFEKWEVSGQVAGKTGQSPAERGENLVQSSGCMSCHSVDGSVKVGPSFKNLMGRTTVFDDRSSLKIDEDYVRESIIDPKAKMVKGFQPIMPSFKNTLTPKDITAIITYIKTLGGEVPHKVEGPEP